MRTFSIVRSPSTLELALLEDAQELRTEVGGISLIASRSRVPWLANSKRPSRRSVAPVKAPRSWPKNSLSVRFSEIAAAVDLDEGAAWRQGLRR